MTVFNVPKIRKKKRKGRGFYLKPYSGKGLKVYRGRGLLNTIIDNLPLSLHIPGYSYCGPGTDIKGNVAKGVKPVNKLDAHCMEHDIFYSKHPDTASRNKADLKLADQAWERVKSSDASLGERAAAYAVTNIMKGKAKLGMGLRGCKGCKKPRNKNGQHPTAKTSQKRKGRGVSRGVHAKRTRGKGKRN